MTAPGDEKAVILMVDDTPTNLSVLFNTLRGSGYRMLVATDGASALARARYAQPDIILLDVMMPRMDGFETCRQLKGDPRTREIPVIFMTALTETGEKVRGFAEGAVDYVTKPIQPEEVLARVRTHLALRALRADLQRKNEDLRQRVSECEELIAELDAFAHTVAHDLKAPLTPIAVYASALNDPAAPLEESERREYLAIIARNAGKIGKIVDALLLLARVRRTQVETRTLDMGRIVADTLSRLDFVIEDSGAQVTTAENWPAAGGYAPWVEEVWANYLTNAIKYGGTPPRVEVGSAVDDDGTPRFWVRDNGEGLTAEQQARLFQPFTRLGKERADGHGLGLSIVQRIVEKLGGTVRVDSDGVPGRGSTFSFTLPKPPG